MANIQESVVPYHQMTQEIGSSSLASQNNLSQSKLFSLLEAVLDASELRERLMISNFEAEQLELDQRNGTEENNGGERNQRMNAWHGRNVLCMGSAYRGVIQCHEQRFEAFAWDYTVEKGKFVYVGAYATAVEAARAHDTVEIKLGCLEKLLNFPAKLYWKETETAKKLSKKEFIDYIREKESDSAIQCHFRGVYRNSNVENNKWEARVGRNGLRTLNLGVYYSADDAARAYDVMSIKIKGWDAITNFDIASYEVKDIMESLLKQEADGTIILDLAGKNNETTEANPESNSPPVQHSPQQLDNSSFSNGDQNPNLIPSNHGIQASAQSSLLGQGNSHGIQASAQSSFLGQGNSHGIQASAQSSLLGQGNSSLARALQNPNIISSNPGIQAHRQSSLLGQGNSSLARALQNPNIISSNPGIQAHRQSSLGQITPQFMNNSSTSHGLRNPNLIGSNPAIQAYPQSNFLGQHNSEQLTNSSFSQGFQNAIVIPSSYGFQPYPQSNFASGAGTSGNSIANLGGVFPNQTATLQHSLQTENQVNANNNIYQNLLNNNNNNQFLPQSSNPPLNATVNRNFMTENSPRSAKYPLNFGKYLLGGVDEFGSLSSLNAMFEESAAQIAGTENGSTGATNDASSSGLEVQPVPPPNQEIGAAQLQLPELDQIYEPGYFQANTMNQNPHEDLNSSFSEAFQEDPGSSSQPNNIGPQNHASGSEIDFSMIDFVSRSYIEDDDFASDFDFFGK